MVNLEDDNSWRNVATLAGIASLILTPIVGLWLYSKIRKNEQRISNMGKTFEGRISDFERRYQEDRKQLYAEYRFLWSKIQNLETTALTLEEKNKLLSRLNQVYEEKVLI